MYFRRFWTFRTTSMLIRFCVCLSRQITGAKFGCRYVNSKDWWKTVFDFWFLVKSVYYLWYLLLIGQNSAYKINCVDVLGIKQQTKNAFDGLQHRKYINTNMALFLCRVSECAVRLMSTYFTRCALNFAHTLAQLVLCALNSAYLLGRSEAASL